MSTIGQRKADHISLCAEGEVGFRGATTLFEEVHLVHDALPELDLAEIDTRCRLFGKELRAPLIIAAMTGGTEEAGRINRGLAQLAEIHGLGFGLGSQRAMHLRTDSTSTYAVRDVAPTALVLGNVGVVQARSMTTAQLDNLVRAIGADALCVHLNPAMELVQVGGDRDFRGCLETLARLQSDLSVPLVVKETGCGLSRKLGERLRRADIRHVDVSGAGGTSWVAVETLRAPAEQVQTRALGEALWDWGIPTAASVAAVSTLGFETIIATGGIASGMDAARAIALGASCAGIARPILKAMAAGGVERADQFLAGILNELRAVMLLTGSADLAALRRAPRVIGTKLRAWSE